jgi:hypothetical protein
MNLSMLLGILIVKKTMAPLSTTGLHQRPPTTHYKSTNTETRLANLTSCQIKEDFRYYFRIVCYLSPFSISLRSITKEYIDLSYCRMLITAIVFIYSVRSRNKFRLWWLVMDPVYPKTIREIPKCFPQYEVQYGTTHIQSYFGRP